MGVWAAIIFAIVIIGLAVFVYFQPAGLAVELEGLNGIDWGDFGSFIGGVVGPLLLFIVLLMIIRTIRQQSQYFDKIFDESKRIEMLRHLGKIDDDITRLLSHEFAVGGQYVQLGDLVDGLSDANIALRDNPTYRATMDKLLKLTATYCEAIGSYRNDIASQFTFDIHQQRARELHAYLESNREVLNPMIKQALSYCKMHLDGKKVTKHKPLS